MFNVLLVLFVLDEYHSPALSGIVLLCSQVPGIVCSPFAGALLDRGAKTKLMGLDYVVGAVSIAMIAFLALLHSLPIYGLLLIIGFGSLTQPLSRVGGKSLYPAIVPRSHWDHANAVDSGGFVMANVLGPAVAGLTVALMGARWAIVIPALFMVLAAALVLRVEVPPSQLDRSSTLTADALGAVRYVWGNRILRMLAGTMSVFNFGQGALAVAVPYLVLHRLHGGSTSVGLMLAIMGMAGFVAGIVTGRFGTEGREKTVLAGSCFATALALCVISVSHVDIVAAIGLAIAGFANGPLTVAMFGLRQRATDPRWFGRAFAVSMNMNYAGVPIGSAIIGAILGHSISGAFFVAGAFCVIGGLGPALLPASLYRPEALAQANDRGHN